MTSGSEEEGATVSHIGQARRWRRERDVNFPSVGSDQEPSNQQSATVRGQAIKVQSVGVVGPGSLRMARPRSMETDEASAVDRRAFLNVSSDLLQ